MTFKQDPIDQLLNGWWEDGEPCGYYYDKEGRKYFTSKHNIEEHKYSGWYWVLEEKGYMRWNDMMEYYEARN